MRWFLIFILWLGVCWNEHRIVQLEDRMDKCEAPR